jgi:hypothetical protein
MRMDVTVVAERYPCSRSVVISIRLMREAEANSNLPLWVANGPANGSAACGSPFRDFRGAVASDERSREIVGPDFHATAPLQQRSPSTVAPRVWHSSCLRSEKARSLRLSHKEPR